jgi:hypothetical protein
MPLIIPSNSISAVGYNVDNSLRFNSGSTDYLNKTYGSAGNRRTMTFSFWIKRSNLSANQFPMSISDQPTGLQADIRFASTDVLRMYATDTSGIGRLHLVTNRVFRDVSAWYHIVWEVDTTQATESDRVKLYINGVQETSFSTEDYPPQNTDLRWNGTSGSTGGVTFVGSINGNSPLDGYMTEVCFIDGTAYDQTSFGEFDEDTNIWKPIDVSGLTFGTNGFYLDFENSGSLGNDKSGNGNNFTVNNLTSIDQVTDSPTNNFATMNPLDNYYFNANYFQDGNLHIRTDGSSYTYLPATFGVSSGKWYWEVEYDAEQIGSYSVIGITSTQSTNSTHELGHYSNDWGYYSNTGQYINSDSRTGYGNTYAVGDIIGVALDLDNNKLYFSKNGTFQNSGDPTSGATGTGAISITAPSSTPLGNYFPAICFFDATGKGTFKANFGNPPYSANGYSDANGYGNMSYSVPSGYYVLNSKNLSEFG